MEPAAFSSALFTALCNDLNFSIHPEDRFRAADLVDPFLDDPARVADAALISSVFKKSEVETSDLAEAVTLLRFLEANQACSEWRAPTNEKLGVGYTLSYARNLLKEWFEPNSGLDLAISMCSIEAHARFGPGRSVGLGKQPSSYYFKVGDAPLTATSDFIRSWYGLSVQNNPLCEAAEMARQARFGPISIAQAGRLTFVPKSYATCRTIMTEASCTTFFQLGLGRCMEGVLKKNTRIDLSVQAGRNARLALQGSLNGSYATIDLKQCSDYIAKRAVAWMFPPSVVKWINILRTQFVQIDGLRAEPYELHMVSTMGNGFTFPLQTVLLTALLLGVYKTLDIPAKCPSVNSDGNYGVFGDDIVVLTHAYSLLCDTIAALGLIVNPNKSFASGSFRESCGHDYYRGLDVRGVYLKRYSTLQDYLSIFNRLAIWGAKHSRSLHESLSFIASRILDSRFSADDLFVPPDEAVVSGIILPYPRKRANSWRYASFIPKINPFKVEPWWSLEEHGENHVSKQWLKALQSIAGGSLNEPALLKSALYGAIRTGSITYRGDEVRYRRVRRTTPRWGWSSNPLYSTMGREQVESWYDSVILAFGLGYAP